MQQKSLQFISGHSKNVSLHLIDCFSDLSPMLPARGQAGPHKQAVAYRSEARVDL